MAGGGGSDDSGTISEINVTPLVDVSLVLLIIFIVTAKIIVNQSALPMDLPKAATGEEVQTIFSVELTADGKTFVDSEEVAGDEAIARLAEQARAKNKDLRAVIRADKKVEHGRVIGVLDRLKRVGVAKIAFAVSKVKEGVAVEAEGEK